MIKFDTVSKVLDWSKEQIRIDSRETKTVPYVFAGSFYWAHLGAGVGSEQSGDRPVLVIDSYKTSSVCVVLPLTTERLNDNRPYHIDLQATQSTVLVEQVRTISKARIYSLFLAQNGERLELSKDEKDKINAQLSNICCLNFDKNC